MIAMKSTSTNSASTVDQTIHFIGATANIKERESIVKPAMMPIYHR